MISHLFKFVVILFADRSSSIDLEFCLLSGEGGLSKSCLTGLRMPIEFLDKLSLFDMDTYQLQMDAQEYFVAYLDCPESLSAFVEYVRKRNPKGIIGHQKLIPLCKTYLKDDMLVSSSVSYWGTRLGLTCQLCPSDQSEIRIIYNQSSGTEHIPLYLHQLLYLSAMANLLFGINGASPLLGCVLSVRCDQWETSDPIIARQGMAGFRCLRDALMTCFEKAGQSKGAF